MNLDKIIRFDSRRVGKIVGLGLCVVVMSSLLTAFSKPKVQVSLKRLIRPHDTNMCLPSLIGPAAKGCIDWEPNIEASPTYEPYRRLILVGSSQDRETILDADTGAIVAKAQTDGRVVTDAKFSPDDKMLLFGTDKGVLYGLDAYSFKRRFSLLVDAKIKNDLVIVGKNLVFTTGVGTLYSVDIATGKLRWRVKQPLARQRTRLSSISTIYAHSFKVGDTKKTTLFVPHADGYVSVIDSSSGDLLKKIQLAPNGKGAFVDIVAPLVLLKGKLWVASYAQGLFSIDVSSYRIRDSFPLIKNVSSLATDGSVLFAATPDVLYGLSQSGRVLWKNDFSGLKSKPALLGFPFNKVNLGERRIFFGAPSRLLLTKHHVVMFTTLGAGGIFDKGNGELDNVFGNSIGFSPYVEWAEDVILSISRRGFLMEFQVK